MEFEWDEIKAVANQKKHGISFEEAITVFDDPFSITIYDPQHSVAEDRFVDIGYSHRGKLLVVVYTERDLKIRIISCRLATNQEQNAYEQS